MAVNKVVYNGRTLIDLTGDTVTKDTLLIGTTAHDKAGNLITGVHKELDISVETAEYTSGLNTQDSIIDQIAVALETNFVVPSNTQSKTVTPSTSKQTVTADNGYDALSSVIVEAIPQSYINQAYQNGYAEGNEVGYAEGNEDGYTNGYNEGYNEAIELYKPYKQELTFIQSSGTQYVDTLYNFSSENVTVEIGFELVSAFTGNSLFGSEASGPHYSIVPHGYSSNTLALYVGKSSALLPKTISVNTHYDLTLTTSNNIITETLNGSVTSASYTGSIKNGRNITIFADNAYNGMSWLSSLKLKYYRIKDNNVLVRDYIPVLGWDDVPCLYDKVTRATHHNSGTGKFIAGAVVAA